jgi:hypothetical protein
MKKSLKDWFALIKTEERGKARSRYYEATCPICAASHSVDVLASDASARVMATQKIEGHIRTSHAEEISES